MLDMNEASEQKEMGSGNVIPPESIVMLQISIRQPGDTFEGSHPALTQTKDGQGEYLGCDVKVATGTFEGSKWVECFNVKNKSDVAVRIGTSQLRAVVEATRGIKPQDATPEAMTARRLQNDYWDFEAMTFPAKIKCKASNDGKYMNNEIDAIVTPDKPEYDQCRAMGEIISDKPIPVLPAQGGASAAPGGKPTWAGGGTAASATPPPASGTATGTPPAGNKPAWAK